MQFGSKQVLRELVYKGSGEERIEETGMCLRGGERERELEI